MNLLIDSVLSRKFGKVRARTQCSRRDAQVQRAECATMCIERFIPGVAQQRARKCGQVNVEILGQNKFGHQQMRQHGFVEIVAKLQASVVLAVQQTLKLEGQVSEAGPEKRILGSALQRKAGERTPL